MTIGRFVETSATRPKIWKSESEPPLRGEEPSEWTVRQVFDEIWKSESEPPPRGEEPSEWTVRQVFDEFKEAMSGKLAVMDTQTHLDLALAYREMGLFSDAVAEAGTALRLGMLAADRASLAVAIVFDERALLISVTSALDLIREAHFQN